MGPAPHARARTLLIAAAAALGTGCASGGRRGTDPGDAAPVQHGIARESPAATARAPAATGIATGDETGAGGGDARPASGGEPKAVTERGGAGGEASGADRELQALRARTAELEATLEALKRGSDAPAGGPVRTAPTPTPDMKALLAMTGRMDGPGVSVEIEKLLLGGKDGFARLHDFLEQADIEHDKIDALTHHPQLIFGLLRVIALHPDEVAAFSSYLLKATRDRPGSWLRREMFNFVPVFILHHQGKYAQLRRDLEDDMIYQIEQGGVFLYKISLAMRDLGFQPPVEIFLPILLDQGRREAHGHVIELLAARKEEGLPILKRYLEETRDFKSPTLGAVIQAIAHLEGVEAGGTVARLLRHENLDIRGPALFAYFGAPRDGSDLPLAIELLNSKEVTPAQKRTFISLLAQKNVEVFDLLFAEAETSIAEEPIKELLRRTAAAVARRKAREAAAAEKKAAAAGQEAGKGPPPK